MKPLTTLQIEKKLINYKKLKYRFKYKFKEF